MFQPVLALTQSLLWGTRYGSDLAVIVQAMKLGLEASAMISKTFLTPIKLEFEKVYCPLLLITKKRYAGVKFVSADKPG